MTAGHKHRDVRVKRGGVAYRVLTRPIFYTSDVTRADRSKYPYGPGDKPGQYYLSLLSVLHRWTGLTLRVSRD